MSIKIYCDICSKEPTELDFAFEARLSEIRTKFVGKEINIHQEKYQRLIHICKDCYQKYLEKLLK